MSLLPGAELGRLQKEIDRERRKLRALQDIGSALGSTLYLLDEDTQELVAHITQGVRKHEIRVPAGEGLAGAVAESGEALNIKDAYQDPRFDGEWDRETGYRTRSTLCVPMKNQHGRTMGVVQVLNKHKGHFTHDDEALLAALATQAAVSIENSKLFLSVVAKNIELLETKEQLEKKIHELDDLLNGVLARTMRAVDADAASILLADEDTGVLRFRAAVGGRPERIKEMKIKAGEGISGWVATHQRAQIVNELDQADRHSRHISDEVGYHPKSLLCVLLR